MKRTKTCSSDCARPTSNQNFWIQILDGGNPNIGIKVILIWVKTLHLIIIPLTDSHVDFSESSSCYHI